MIKKLKISLLILFLLLPCLTKATIFGDVVINEIAWMGTTNSANDEWIELYNNSGNIINLESWILKADDGSPEIKLKGEIPPDGFYLLERTDDNTVPEIKADLIYKGALENIGENLKLFDSSGNLIDEVNAEKKWFAGNNITKQTMSKIDSLLSGNNSENWANSESPAGTPKAKNKIALAENKPIENEPPIVSPPLEIPVPTMASNENQIEPGLPSPIATPIARGDVAMTCPEGIIFNEILPSAEGSDEENEWIEIFNQKENSVDLSGLTIKDSEGAVTSYVFPDNSKIGSKEYLVLKRGTTKIILNNTSDKLELLCQEKLIDSVSYEKAKIGQSYNRIGQEWKWSDVLTPGKENIISTSKSQKQSFSKNSSPQTKEKTENGFLPANPKEETANIGEKAQNSLKNLYPFAIALILAIFSATAIFVLKKTLRNNGK